MGGKRKERKRAGKSSQRQPCNETKWAGTEEPGESDRLCRRMCQVHRKGANGGGGQDCWVTESHISTRGSPRAPWRLSVSMCEAVKIMDGCQPPSGNCFLSYLQALSSTIALHDHLRGYTNDFYILDLATWCWGVRTTPQTLPCPHSMGLWGTLWNYPCCTVKDSSSGRWGSFASNEWLTMNSNPSHQMAFSLKKCWMEVYKKHEKPLFLEGDKEGQMATGHNLTKI